MNRVLVLGSRPGATIPRVDVAYCANASASYYADQLKAKGVPEVVTVAAAGVLRSAFIEKASDRDWACSKFKRIVESPFTRFVLYGRVSGGDPLLDHLEEAGLGPSVERLSVGKKAALVEELSGLSEPIRPDGFWRNPVFYSNSYIKWLVKRRIDWLEGKELTHSPFFRPSTGLVSLCLAIHENGEDSAYLVSGIGMSRRGVYADGARSSKHIGLRHVGVDRVLLKLLSRRYDVKFCDSDLSSDLLEK